MAVSKRIRILCMEDDAGLARLTKKTLTAAGFTVEVAADGEEGLSMWAAGSYDVLLVDQTMPVRSGLDVIRALAFEEPLPPTVMVTGTGNEEIAVQAMKLGAGDYVVKDAEGSYLDLLPTVIERLLEQQRLGEEKRQAEEALQKAHDELEARVKERTAELEQANEKLSQEVADRTKAEEALRESEERFRQLANLLPQTVFEVDGEGNLIYTNRHGLEISGYSRDDLEKGLHILELFSPEDRERVEQDVHRLLMGGIVHDRRYTALKKDGNTYPVLLYSGLILRDGEPAGLRGIALDITEQVWIEQALRESEERFRELSELLPLPVFECDREGNFTYSNTAGFEASGYAQEDLEKGLNALALVIPEHREGMTEQMQNAMAGGMIAGYQYTAARKDGSTFEALIYGSPIILAEEAVGLRAVALDITERVRMEERLGAIYQLGRELTLLRDEELLIQRALETAAQVLRCEYAACGLVDEAAGEIVYRRRLKEGELEQVDLRLPLGGEQGLCVAVVRSGDALNVPDVSQEPSYVPFPGDETRSELCVPLKVGDRVIGVLNADSTEADHFAAEDLQVLQTLADQTAVALENARLFGEVQQRARELDALNKAAGAVTSTLDLSTVLDQTIAEARTLLDAEAGSVLLYEPETGELAFTATDSPAAEALVGARFPSTAGIAGAAVQTGAPVLVADAQQDPRFYSGIDESTGMITRTLVAVPLRYRDQIIGVVEVLNKATGPFDQHDVEVLEGMSSSAAIAIANARLYQDLNEQMEALQKTQAQLIHSEKMSALGRLVASITHEINNPLQAVQTYVTLAQEDLSEAGGRDRVERYLGIVESEIERVSTIVHRMRDFYRPARARVQPTDLHPVLESVLALADRRLQHCGVTVEREWADELPEVRANADHLKQVFLNLVLNAADAMPSGGTLQLRTSFVETGEREPAVRIDFVDEGVGLSPERQARLFEPFFTTKEKGSGLGLYISYGIVEAHDGDILVESKEGEGSTFSVVLPVEGPPPAGDDE